MCRWRGEKIEDYWFPHEFGKEIFFLYREINNPQIKFWVKNMLVASYSRAVIASNMCWKVTFGHHFDNNFCTVRNFWTWPECFTKHTFGVWIWTQPFYFFDWNRDFYRPLNMSHRGTRNKDSSYVQMEGFKNWRLLICPQICQGNIFPISWDQ